jgi:hypothetical protein
MAQKILEDKQQLPPAQGREVSDTQALWQTLIAVLLFLGGLFALSGLRF